MFSQACCSLMKSVVPPSKENRVYCTINPGKANGLSGFKLLSTRACFWGAWQGGSLASGPAVAASPLVPAARAASGGRGVFF